MAKPKPEAPAHPQAYGATGSTDQPITSHYELQKDVLSPTAEATYDRFDDEEDNEDEMDDPYDMSLTELLYSSSSYHAIAKPVSLTMILAALSVVYINNEETLQQGEAAMSEAYTVWQTDSDSTTQNLALSLGNAFVMVCVICAMTFLIVLLYKFKCMKLLIGYMILSSATLLGLLGGSMFEVAIQIYQIPIDTLTFYLAMYNFAVVGVMAVFWTKGIPTYVTQGYLIATSVILAWQLAHFDTWTTWTLLVMLALYDLCAVLTPCGPLRALVNLMSEEDSPDMPGLLYEAELPPEAQRPGVPNQARTRSDLEPPLQDQNLATAPEQAANDPVEDDRSVGGEAEASGTDAGEDSNESNLDDPTIEIPLALARVYNLPIVGITTFAPSAGTADAPLLAGDLPETPTVTQLKSLVMVRLPRQGGRVEKIGNGKTYLERDRFGTPKRTLWVDRHGKVFAEACDDEDEEDGKSSNSIRLGLGDFIFYSVLVGKAAQYSFTTFAACMLVILAGLGGTLVLLAVFHHALPALPISIFLGVLFYILTRLLIEPWIEAVMQRPYYV